MNYIKNIKYEQLATFVMITTTIILLVRFIIEKTMKKTDGNVKLKIINAVHNFTDIGLCLLLIMGIAVVVLH
jgi:hypothetical protein